MSADAFAATGLTPVLAQAAAALGHAAPTPLQRAALPLVRRGSNVVLRASTGAGVTLSWGAGVLERIPDLPTGGGPRALIVTATRQRAEEIAEALGRLVEQAAGDEGEALRSLRIRALAPGWAEEDADLLAASFATAAEAVSTSRLKLDALGVLVLDDVAAMLALDGASILETILITSPREAQRIFVTHEMTRDVERFAEAHARRALHVPPRSSEDGAAGPPTRSVAYRIVGEPAKLSALSDALAVRDAAQDVVLVRSAKRADDLRAALQRRGLASDAGGPDVAVWGDEERGTIAWDVPWDAAGLRTLAGDSPLILITPEERAHLRTIARDAGIALESAPRGAPAPESAAAWRRRVSRAIDEEDLDAQILLLAPLFTRHAAEEVAAALSALLRRKVSAAEQEPMRRQVPAAPSYVRLFFSAGQRDGLRPADLVGAITGETGIAGDRVGRVDIRDTFSVVEVDGNEAEKVIRALNGTTMRGRSIRVDYDRRSSPGAVRRSRPPRPGATDR